jgi:hypothetical protein
MGDPISTIKDLLKKISVCEERAAHFAERPVVPGDDALYEEREWKALATIAISYDEWGLGIAAQKALDSAL